MTTSSTCGANTAWSPWATPVPTAPAPILAPAVEASGHFEVGRLRFRGGAHTWLEVAAVCHQDHHRRDGHSSLHSGRGGPAARSDIGQIT